ncbi:MAG: DinB family protein [candidate division Zixibacteria bacterium]
MQKREHLKFILERCKGGIDALLKNITEEDSLFRLDGYPNHIRWEVGHMARGLSQILNCLTDETDFPKNWTELFSRGAVLASDSSVYPSLEEIKLKMDYLYDKIFSVLDKIEDEKLEEEIQIFTEWKNSRIHGALFLCMHDFHHGGQIMVLRRVIGKERVFG